MKGVYWLILLQYSVININSQIIHNDKLGSTPAPPSTESPEIHTNQELPRQFHPNFLYPHGPLDYGPFGTHPMSRPTGQSNMMFQLPGMFNPATPDMFPMVPPPIATEMLSQQLAANPHMLPGQHQNMMPMMARADHPAILPVMSPEQQLLAPGMFLPNPSFSTFEYPFSAHPTSPVHPESAPAQWAPPHPFPEISGTTLPPELPPTPAPVLNWNAHLPENFYPDMNPFVTPPIFQYQSHVSPTPHRLTQQQYYHPRAMSFLPQPNSQQPSNPQGGGALSNPHPLSNPSPSSMGVEGQAILPPSQSEVFIGPLPPDGTHGNPQPFSYPTYLPEGSKLGPYSVSPTRQDFFPGPFSDLPFHPIGTHFPPQPFSHHPFQPEGNSQPFQKPPSQAFSPFNFMPPLPHDQFLFPIPPAGDPLEPPEVLPTPPPPGRGIPMDPAAELGDFPGVPEFMNPESPFVMPPPPFLNRHPAPQFPVLPPFLEGLPAPSENGQRVPGKKWSYKNSGHLKWPSKYSYCSGNRQSPVDIDDRNIIYTPNLKQFTFTGFDGYNSAFTVKNNGHTASIRISGNMSVSGGGFGDVYNTAEIHFHWGSNDRDGSEHAINGRKYPLEMHIVNYATKYGDLKNAMQYRDGLGVLGVLFDIGQENPAFAEFERHLKKVQNPGASVPLPTIRVRDLLPVNADAYFRYYGSLTTPPCYQSVLWTIFEQHQTISSNQLESLRSLYETTKNFPETPNAVTFGEALLNNFRPLQPMFGRIINTNIKRYADPIYMGHPGIVNIPTVFRQSAPTPILPEIVQVTLQPQGFIPQFHPNGSPIKSAAAATAPTKQGINQLTSLALAPQQIAINNLPPSVTDMPTISSFRGTNGSVITVVDVPGNVTKPTELIVVNTSAIVEQLNQPAARPTPGSPQSLKPQTAVPQTTTHMKQLHPVISSAATRPTTAATTSVTPTLLPITSNTATSTTKATQATTLTTPTLLPTTSPTMSLTTSTISASTSPSTSTSQPTTQPINSPLNKVVQNFPLQGSNQLLPEPVQVQSVVPSRTLQPTSSTGVQNQIIDIPVSDPVASQLPSAIVQDPIFNVVNPVDLSTQVVTDPLLQAPPQSPVQAQLSVRIAQEARKVAIEAAQQQLAKGSQPSPQFTQSVIEAATKAAQAQFAQLIAESAIQAATQQLPLAQSIELASQTQQPSQQGAQQQPAQLATTQTVQQTVNPVTNQQAAQQQLTQQTENQAAQQQLVQQAENQAAQQQLAKQAAIQAEQQQVAQQAANQAAQQQLAQQAANQATQQQLAQQAAIQAAQQQLPRQAANTAGKLSQKQPQQLTNQAIEQLFAQQLANQQAANQATQQQTALQTANQAAQQQTAQQAANQAAQQQIAQQAANQAAQQQIAQQAASQAAQQQISQQAANQAAQQQIMQQAANQAAQQQSAQKAANQAAQQQISQQAANQAAQQQILQQAANQAAQQQISQKAANQAAQQQILQQAANQAAQQQISQQAANQAAQQQIAQQAANQAAQQQSAQKAANQAAQQQILQQAAIQASQQQISQQAANQAAQQQSAQKAANQAAQQQILQQAANQAAQRQLAQQAANQAAQQQLAQQAANQAAQQQLAQQAAYQAAQQQIMQQAANQAAQQQTAQTQLIQKVLARLRKQANFNKLTQPQIVKLVANRVILHQNQQANNRASQLQISKPVSNPLISQQLLQTPPLQTSRLQTSNTVRTQTLQHASSQQLQQPASQQLQHPASQQLHHPASQQLQHPASQQLRQPASQQLQHSASKQLQHPASQQLQHLASQQLHHPGSQQLHHPASQQLQQPASQQLQRGVQISNSAVTSNRQGTKTNTGNLLIQPSVQGTPVVSILRKTPSSTQTRTQKVQWAALQRARPNSQVKTNGKSQALTATKSVSVLVPRKTNIVPTVRFSSTSQKLHPVNVLPNQMRYKDPNTVTKESSLVTSVQSYPRPPTSSTRSQSSLIEAYFRALTVSKPEVVPVLRRVRTQYGEKKLLNYLQKKYGRLRNV